ncbi:hypothetical protein [Streptomyces sp. NPDC059786]|uniref:hypothetical protein n=1 Tax=Streptomyces sp. NPDC059786 TaxID=3346946 RepID=UPI0036668158
MSDQTALDPNEIPKFTGDLEQLEKDVSALSTDAFDLWDAGSQIDTRFQGLSSFYEAPEADKLFATTAPVATAGDELCTELGTVASALGTYAAEIRPLVAKFESLRTDAAAFARSIADDDDWREDGDKVDENNGRREEVNAAWAAFQAAERTCYNKIVALVGGTPLTLNDGTNGEHMYGYRAEDLNNAEGLPWGDPVEESTPWYMIHEHLWDFTKGFFVDGVWGTIKGLGTLVGFDGWDAAGQAWTGLGKLLTGIVITGMPIVGTAYWLMPDDKLPSWLRDSRTAVVETGKALVAWDEWGKNPSRAAGAVTFNVLTTVFTGGSGTAAKTGAIAKAISFAGKAGRIVDPMTYIAKGVGAGFTRIGDVMASLKGVTNGTWVQLGDNAYRIAEDPAKLDELPAGLTPENSVRLEENGEVVYLNTETLQLHNVDGTVRESLDSVQHEGTAPERAAQASHEEPAGVRTEQPQLVGVGAGTHAAESAATAGRGADTVTVPGGRSVDSLGETPVGRGSGGGRGGGGLGGLDDVGRAGDDAAGDAGRAGSGDTGGLDDLGRTGDDAADAGHAGDDAAGDAGRAGDDAAGDAGHAGDDAAGDAGRAGDEGQQPARERTPEEAKKIVEEQIKKANDPTPLPHTGKSWFETFYRSDGHRRSVMTLDEHGNELPILAKDSDGSWISKDSLPAKPGAKSYPDPHSPFGADTAPLHELDDLNKAAKNRHVANALIAAEQAYNKTPDAAHLAELNKAQQAFTAEMPELNKANSSIAEALGEQAAMRHIIPEAFADQHPQWIDLPKTPNGANMFDQLYRLDDGSLVIAEAKAPKARPIWRRGAGSAENWMVQQGTRPYIETIIAEMTERGGLLAKDSAGNVIRDSSGKPVTNAMLARQISQALKSGKLQYVMVKATENTGKYAGASLDHFKIY